MILVKSNFIENLFKHFKGEGVDQYGIVSNNLVVLAASIYSQNPDLFNPFTNEDY